MTRIFVVEDDRDIADLVSLYLTKSGWQPQVFDSGTEALAAIRQAPPVLVILDLMLPGMDGLAVCRALRSDAVTARIPVIMVTARGDETDRIVGLELGADDYLPKPFELTILVARLHALLRRQAWKAAPPPPDQFIFAGRTVDFSAQELRVGGQVYPLTLMETNLLRYLVRHDGQTVSRKQMLEEVWNLHEDTDTRAIDHFMSRLRKYVETQPSLPKHLLTVRGVGYRFESGPR